MILKSDLKGEMHGCSFLENFACFCFSFSQQKDHDQMRKSEHRMIWPKNYASLQTLWHLIIAKFFSNAVGRSLLVYRPLCSH